MKRAALLGRARDLYAQGFTLEQIALAPEIRVRPATISGWKKADSGTAYDWDLLRSQARRKSPLALLQTLEAWREGLIDAAGAKPGAGEIDALWKLERIIDSLRGQVGDPSRILNALEHFARYCSLNRTAIGDEDLAAIRKAVEMFAEDLRCGT